MAAQDEDGQDADAPDADGHEPDADGQEPDADGREAPKAPPADAGVPADDAGEPAAAHAAEAPTAVWDADALREAGFDPDAPAESPASSPDPATSPEPASRGESSVQVANDLPAPRAPSPSGPARGDASTPAWWWVAVTALAAGLGVAAYFVFRAL